MLKRAIFAFSFLFLVRYASAQEFLCNVQIQAQQIAGVDQSVFDAMEKSIFEFMNNRKWSEFNYKIEERIECTMIFTIQNAVQGGDEFSGTLNVVLQRPVYGSDYNSVVINLVDNDIKFVYTPYQSMEYADNTFQDNLTQLLAYYAYLMIGLDQDSFSLFGGTAMYEKANSVVQVAQTSNYKGWQVFDGQKSRYQVIENLLNQSYNDIRKFLYEYHRKGLDVMAENLDGGRTEVTSTLSNLKSVYDKRPNLYILQIVLEAKRQEIINIYMQASPAEKVAMINIMSAIDPPNGNKYEAVNK
jgi:hypothetical protein